MKTQMRKPVSEKTHYSDEYKQQAVERWRHSVGRPLGAG